MMRAALAVAALSVGVASLSSANLERPHLYRHEASRVSMACTYAIEAYGAAAKALPHILEEALDEVDRIARLMSHYKATSSLARVNQQAARHPVRVEPELFEFIATALR